MSQREESKGFVIDQMEELVSSYISLQGNIGAGKSVLLDAIDAWLARNRMDGTVDYDGEIPVVRIGEVDHYFVTVREPVGLWTKECYLTEEGEPISFLKLFYGDMAKYATRFQVKAFTSRLNLVVEAVRRIRQRPNARVHLLAERSMRTDMLFFQNLGESGIVPPLEWQIDWPLYKDFFDMICTQVLRKENIMVALNTAPDKCHARLHGRDRKDETETGVSIDYLSSLEKKHSEMLDAFRADGKRVIELDFNRDMSRAEIDEVADRLMRQLMLIAPAPPDRKRKAESIAVKESNKRSKNVELLPKMVEPI